MRVWFITNGLLSEINLDDAYRRLNPFTADPVKALHFAILVYSPFFLNFWHLGDLALKTERQITQMSKIKNGDLDQYGAGPIEQQQFGTTGVEGYSVKN